MTNVVPVIAVAAARSARRRVLEYFTEAGAWSGVDAVRYVPNRRLEQRYLDSLLDFGAAVRVGPDTYYLDPEKLRAHSGERRRRGATVAGALFVVAAAVAALTR